MATSTWPRRRPHQRNGISSTTSRSQTGSAPLPAQTLEEFRTRYGHTILERYGMSETLMNIAMKYRDRVDVSLMLPQVNWREPKNDRRIQMSMPSKSSAPEPRADLAASAGAKGKKA